jgi:hypothetical protein
MSGQGRSWIPKNEWSEDAQDPHDAIPDASVAVAHPCFLDRS